MPKTKAALDSLLARLIRTESLATIGVFIVIAVDEFGTAGVISAGVASAALALGRSLVKSGRLDKS